METNRKFGFQKRIFLKNVIRLKATPISFLVCRTSTGKECGRASDKTIKSFLMVVKIFRQYINKFVRTVIFFLLVSDL